MFRDKSDAELGVTSRIVSLVHTFSEGSKQVQPERHPLWSDAKA